MTELDPEEEAVLEGARRALSPPDVVTQRMRAALLVKVAAPGIVVGASAAAASSAAASSAAAASVTGGAAAVASATAATSGAAASLAAAAGGAVAGAKIALGAGVLKAAAGITTAVLLATATSPYWLPEATAPRVAPAPAVAAPVIARSTPRTAPAAEPRGNPDLSPPSADNESTAAEVLPPRSATSPNPGAAPHRTPALSDTPEQKLQVELDLLRRAQQAIQAGQARSALELLARLDAEHPASSLRQEREVARVLALCGVGRVSAARDVAQRVLAASPNSLYASRIQASCAGLPPRPSAENSVASPGKSTGSAPPVARFGDSGN